MPGLSDAMAALMQQFGGSTGTVPGAMPSAYQVNQAAATVPQWTPGGVTGNAPMASPLQSVPGMTAQPGAIMQALSQPQSYGGQQGGGLARQGIDMAASAAATAALTPILGPAAPIVGPMIAHVGTSFIPHKGGGAPAPAPQLKQSVTQTSQMPDLGVSSLNGDQYAMLMQMLQSGNMRM